MTTVNSSTSSTGLISSAGIGSGLDVNAIVNAMVAAESQPITDLQKQSTAMQTKLSALGSVKSYLATFRDAAAKLSQPASWNATTSSSNNTGAVTASTGVGAAIGNYSVSVSKLATAQTLSSRVFSSTETPGAGTLTVQRTSGGGPVDISVLATDTLAEIRDKFNASDSGLTAHIQSDSAGARLVVQSSKTGSDEAFSITASDGAGGAASAGLAALAYNPAALTNPMALQQTAGDANATINGVAVVSKSNTLNQVVDGLTLTLSGVTTTPATVTVAQDTAAIKTSITAMVSAYNAVQAYMAAQTKYDPSTKTAATLQGDGTTNTIRTQLRTMMGAVSGASSTYTRFSDIGFDLQKDGSVNVNATKLDSALSNPGELRKLFSNADATVSSNNGLATQLRKLGDSILGSDGVLTTRANGIQSNITSNSKRQADLQTRVDQYERRVKAQYNALDTKMSSLNSLSAYVSQQITQMNKSNN